MSQSRQYRVYLLRLWQVTGEDGAVVWRASLEDARTSERRGFADLARLAVFLEAQAEIWTRPADQFVDQSLNGGPMPDEHQHTSGAPKACPACGAANNANARLCASCGSQIVSGSDLAAASAKLSDGVNTLIGGLVVAGGLLYAVYRGLQALGAQSESTPAASQPAPAPHAPRVETEPTTQRAQSSQAGWEECEITLEATTRRVGTVGVEIYGTPYYDRSRGPAYTEYVIVVETLGGQHREIYRSKSILEDVIVRSVDSVVFRLQQQGWQPSGHGTYWYSYRFRRAVA
jgi:hypothetical protein